MRRRPESTAHRIAAAAVGRRSTDQDQPGAVLGTYSLDGPGGTHRSITAAAQIVLSKTVASTKVAGVKQSWQKDSFRLRRVTGEFRFSGDRVARAVGQMRLYAGKVEQLGDKPAEQTSGPAFDLCQQAFGSLGGTQQALHRAAQHLQFTGESYLALTETASGYEFSAHSVTETNPAGQTWTVNDGLTTRRVDPAQTCVIRCWTPDPELAALADAPAQAVLPVARELEGLTKHVSAQIDSRLAGAGILVVPQGIDVLHGQGRTDDPDVDADDSDLSPFVRDLMEMMLTPIKDRDSAAALVPLVAEVAPELVGKLQHLKLHEPLDPKAKELREEAIRRIALGMDSDPSVLLGMATGNHWSAWQISEQEVTLVVAPVVATICHALTVGFLHPALQQLGVPDWQQYLLWFDASALQLRPDRSADSREMFDRGAFSLAALLRENGFADSDAPEQEERKTILLTKLLIGAPSLAPLLLPLLGIEVDASTLAQTSDIADATTGGPTPTTGGTPPPPEQEKTPPPRNSLPERQPTPDQTIDSPSEAK